MLNTAEMWHRTMLPKHFRASATSEYQYRRRSKKHLRQKRKRVGHEIPLVYSGDMKRMLTRRSKVGGTAKRVSVTMSGPRYLYMRRKNTRMPDMAGEITSTTKAEERKLMSHLDRRVERRIKAIKDRETVTT
jgi:hypothetical protein